jgi:stringent starvation protein B
MRPTNRLTLVSATALFLCAWPSGAREQQQQDQQQTQQKSQQQEGQQQSSAKRDQAQKPAAQQDSLAAAARKAREQRKESPKAAKVFTNDNIPTTGGISSVGAETGTESGNEGKLDKTSASGGGAESAAKGSTSNDEAKWRSRFAGLRHKLEQDQAELDVMQRELGVLDTQYYSDPNKQMQQQLSREDINKKTAAIESKKKDIEADKQAISDAEDDQRKAGGDPGWANPQ